MVGGGGASGGGRGGHSRRSLVPLKLKEGGGIYDIFARERPLLRGEFMLPTGDGDLWLYLQGIFFICIGTAFTANNYFSPLCVLFCYFFFLVF